MNGVVVEVMTMPATAGETTVPREEHADRDLRRRANATDAMSALAMRIRGEFREMPGLRLTVRQAARLFGVPPHVANAVLQELRSASVLARSHAGAFFMSGDRVRTNTPVPPAARPREEAPMRTEIDGERSAEAALKDASLGRLACLQRHWAWTAEAKARFEEELADGWNDDDDPMSDRPFGAYHHWCALLCALVETAIEGRLLSPAELTTLGQDLEACLPALRSSRQLLVVIPDALEHHPRMVALLRDRDSLPRLRRVHQAFGEALVKEHVSRENDTLDP